MTMESNLKFYNLRPSIIMCCYRASYHVVSMFSDVWNTLQAIPNDLIGSALKPVTVDTAGGGKLLISTGSDGR